MTRGLCVFLIVWAGSAWAQGLPEGGTRTVLELMARGGVVEGTGTLGDTPLVYISVEGAQRQLWLCRMNYDDFASFADPRRIDTPPDLSTICALLR